MNKFLLPFFAVVFILPILALVPAVGDEPAPPAEKFGDKWPPPAAAAPKGLVWGGDKKLYTPADATRHAALDAQTLSKTLVAEELQNIRYLSLANVPSELRPQGVEVVSFVLNSLSHEKDLVLPAVVGPDNILVRVNLADYGIKAADWDAMGDKDPYFHQPYLETAVAVKEVEVVKKVPYEVEETVHQTNSAGQLLYYTDGKPYMVKKKVTKYREETVKEEQKQEAGTAVERTTPGAAWLDPDAVATLLTLLYPPSDAKAFKDKKNGRQLSPILRADWFIVNATLPPFYYDLLRLKKLDDAKELALFDVRAERFTQTKATVVFSGSDGIARRVARNNRILERVQTVFGAWWETFDFKTSIKQQNVVHNFLTEKRDGGEIIFTLPNGLQGYFLVDAKDNRVDEVPIDIAVDSLAQDARVRNGRSCIWCHSQGMQPFKSDFKAEINPTTLIDLGIKADDPKAAVDLVRQIRKVFETPDFDGIVKVDNARYNNAVKAASGGKSSAAMASAFLLWYDDYQEVPMDAARLPYEAGISDLDVQAAIKVQLNGTNNGVLLRRLLTPPLAIRRDHWEEAYADFMLRVLAWEKAKKDLNLVPKEGPK